MRFDKSLVALGLLWVILVPSPACAVTVTQVADLSFGQILGGATGTVTIPVSPTGPGTRTGPLTLLLTSIQFNQGRAGEFTVTNDTEDSATYTISLNSTPSNLNSGGLSVSAFSLSKTSVTLAAGASTSIYVGATLTVNSSSLSAGTYTATTPISLQAL